MNTINRLRVSMGLSRPKMLELIGAKPGRLNLLVCRDDQIEPDFLEKANNLKKRYDLWVQHTNAKLDEYERRDFTVLTSSEVHDLLGLRDAHISQLRYRGTIKADREGYGYTYTLTSLRELVTQNSQALAKGSRVRGPLTFGFLRWLGRQDGLGIDLTHSSRREFDRVLVPA